MDKGRGSKALAVTALVFLLAGTGAGFAAAADDADEQATLPWPGVGDRATYRVRPVLLEPGLEPWDLEVEQITMEWQEPRVIVDEDWTRRLVLPLEVVFHRTDRVQIPMVAYYDAASGAPVADGRGYGKEYDGGLLGDTVGREEAYGYWYNLFEAMRGPCGALSPFHGGALSQEPVDLAGHCRYFSTYLSYGGDEEIYGGTLMTSFVPLGVEDGLYGYGSARDEGVEVWYEPGQVFPARRVAPLMNVGGADGRLWRMDRVSSTPASVPYGGLVDSIVEAGPGPVRLTTRTPWNLDDGGLGHPFSLHEAYRAALEDTAEPTVSRFLDAHPGAYLGQAWSLRGDDGTSNHHHYWYMTWSDGFDTISKQVVSRPLGVQGISIGAVRTVEVNAWQYQDIEQGQRHFPAPSALPARLPLVSDLMDRYRFVEDPGRLPDETNRYGMGYYCDTAACEDPRTYVAAGFYISDLGSYGTAVRTTVEGNSEAYSQIMVDADGGPRYTETFEYHHDPAVALELPAKTDTDDAGYGGATAWLPPAAGATAGLGALAILAGALYYFWPAIKGLPLFGGFSRIQGDAVLGHPARQRIYEAVQADPGVHFTALRKRLDLGRGVLEHHLKKLQDSGHVTARAANGYKCLFPRGVPDRALRDATPVTRAAGAQAILGVVGSEPGLAPCDVAERTGLAPSTVSYHLGKLRKAGVVEGRTDLHLTSLGTTLRAKAAA